MQESRTCHMELEQMTRERTSLELKSAEFGRRLEQLQVSQRAGEQEKVETLHSCHALTQQVDRLEAELARAKNEHAHAQQDMQVLYQVGLWELIAWPDSDARTINCNPSGIVRNVNMSARGKWRIDVSAHCLKVVFP